MRKRENNAKICAWENSHKIEHDRLTSRLSYDPETGVFIRIMKANGRGRVGQQVGSVDIDGYRSICVDYVSYPASHLAWFYVTQKWPDAIVDHQDGERDNNRFKNLRETGASGNSQNRHGPNKGKVGGLPLGVYPQGSRFFSSISTNGKRMRLGTFDTADEAYSAYLVAKRELHTTNTL